jgi:hypothetical protein
MKPIAIPNLTAFTERLPKTRIGILRFLWPNIWKCLESGYTLREIHQALKLDGIEMAYSTLCWAVAELRQDGAPGSRAPATNTKAPTAPHGREKQPAGRTDGDPLGNLKRLTQHRPGFEYTGTLPDEQLFGPK